MALDFPKINERVEDLGIKQNVMAKKLGISTSTVSDKLRGKSEWTLSEGVALAEWLGVPLEVLTDKATK